MRSSVAGSNVVAMVSPPSIRIGALAMAEVASTSGSRATASFSSGLSPVADQPSATITRSPPNWSRTVPPIDDLIDPASTVNRVTTATPIMRAEAVPAVRRGLRTALRRASVPDTPRRAAAGAPSRPAAGRAATGPSRTTPTTVARAPRPVSEISPSPRVPAKTRPTPAAVSAAPAAARSRELADRSTAASRRAASGAVRAARTAGPRLASSVTTTPTTAAVTTLAVPTTSCDVGMAMPAASIRAMRPVARPMPAAIPAADATIPVASASTVIDRSTWPREAPSARSSADSRVRWATRIEKVL